VVNRLFQLDADCRRRKLRLRTYAVLCLSEDTGLLEWVAHTAGMRNLISACQKRATKSTVRISVDLKGQIEAIQKLDLHDPKDKLSILEKYKKVRAAFPVCFHTWFRTTFSTPSSWFDARLAFARSAAVWSMVGYVVGLGDRHGENILIDKVRGECVHVDFDCLFDKGLALVRPEIVPFRLTPNMVDAFGLSGAEGVYRRVCEQALHVLRANRETLMSVLEAFVHDPCVEWVRKEQKQHRNETGGQRHPQQQARAEAAEAKRTLRTIDQRLRGIFTLRTSMKSANRFVTREQKDAHSLPLSINGQVDRLIKEATSELRLSQMYIGWMPFM